MSYLGTESPTYIQPSIPRLFCPFPEKLGELRNKSSVTSEYYEECTETRGLEGSKATVFTGSSKSQLQSGPVHNGAIWHQLIMPWTFSSVSRFFI